MARIIITISLVLVFSIGCSENGDETTVREINTFKVLLQSYKNDHGNFPEEHNWEKEVQDYLEKNVKLRDSHNKKFLYIKIDEAHIQIWSEGGNDELIEDNILLYDSKLDNPKPLNFSTKYWHKD